jgi:hypothetical protein
MFRNAVAPSIICAMMACRGGSKAEPAGGPLYTPIIANSLRGVAPNCKLEKTATSHTRECTGRPGRVAIALDGNDRFSSLTIALKSMVLFEARNHLEPPLEVILGTEGRDQAILALAKLQTGQSDQLVVGNATIAIDAGGPSKIAPAYTVTITW